ncbi:sigma factor-like helix-turn-helix DNA-binding protein [Rhodococcus sp. NPDC127528]|uniref:sigma factor-like helix-turn-helix DNA-binding protein n=1 Tax=unclassified Rhodococcus (in: high G+C Gram-positive bacteria) TaxID=192944 RepID=UPI00362EA470
MLVRERDVVRALVELPPEQRQPLVLAYYRGMSCDEVAKSLSLDVGVVIDRVHDGLTTLASLLQAPSA